MKKTTVSVVVVVLVILAIIVAIALGMGGKKTSNSGTTNNSSSSNPATPNAAATDQVTIQNFAYTPATIAVKVGTKVTWTNKDSVNHTVTADTASTSAPASGSIAQNEAYSFTFNKAGTYAYHCAPHPYMHGTVIVTE